MKDCSIAAYRSVAICRPPLSDISAPIAGWQRLKGYTTASDLKSYLAVKCVLEGDPLDFIERDGFDGRW
ncbi:hypothetical protein ACPOL_0316 [Acidisarcina polymorpha]|uniref:Uncharacterized protein n=1 Tax=Acidisarcina polymorpha TaxID=2211140 RepID=A0A2Z5FSC3_9BACT|nr:hypothetical protein ACPOL_0316 [Acidisarcina polymorpha]